MMMMSTTAWNLIQTVHLSDELFLICQRIRAELLCLLPRPLLILAHVMRYSSLMIHIHPLTSLLSCHVEDGRCLARVIDDDIVDIIIVNDVGHMAASSVLDPLMLLVMLLILVLMVAWWGSTTAHPEALAVTNALTFKPALVLALLRHRVLRQLLTAPERALCLLLIRISITVYKVVIFLLARLSLIRLLRVVRAEDASIAISHVTLTSQLALLINRARVILKVGL